MTISQNATRLSTLKAIRDEFWNDNPQFKRISGWKQNQYKTDIRVSFIDFVENLRRNGDISEALANRTTL